MGAISSHLRFQRQQVEPKWKQLLLIPVTFASQWVPGEAANEIHAPSLQPVHKNEGGWRHHQVAVVSMGVPRRPQMRYTHQVRSLRKNARGGGSHCRVTVGSMGAPQNAQMRGTHQLRSLRTKSSGPWGPLSGHGWLNQCFQEAPNEIHAASPQPAHKNKGSRLLQ